MERGWRPVPGMIALIETDERPDCLTGVVVPDERRILIDLGGSPGLLAKRESVVASFFAPDALYKLHGVALAGAGKLLELLVDSVERVQRRQATRTRMSCPVSLAAFDGPSGFTTVRGETIDIAPGGCRVATERPFPPGVDPTVTITLPGNDSPVVALAHVLESDTAPGHYEYRMVFHELTPDDADRLRELVPA